MVAATERISRDVTCEVTEVDDDDNNNDDDDDDDIADDMTVE